MLIGGDFATSTFAPGERDDPRVREAALAADPLRLVEPGRYEPLFDVAAAHGYDWRGRTLPCVSTERPRPEEAPRPPGRTDRFFALGLVCRKPAVVPAIDEAGRIVSGHEAIPVEIAHRRG